MSNVPQNPLQKDLVATQPEMSSIQMNKNESFRSNVVKEVIQDQSFSVEFKVNLGPNKSWSLPGRSKSPFNATIYHLVTDFVMRGEGNKVRGGPDDFHWQCWNVSTSTFPPVRYLVFGKLVDGQIRYVTYNSNSEVLFYEPNPIDPPNIDMESPEMDPRLFFFEKNYLMVAANKKYVILNELTDDVETSQKLGSKWNIHLE